MFSVFYCYFYIPAIVTYSPNKWFWNRDFNLTFGLKMGMRSSSSITAKYEWNRVTCSGIRVMVEVQFKFAERQTNRQTHLKQIFSYPEALKYWNGCRNTEDMGFLTRNVLFFPSKWTFSCIHTFCWHRPRAVTQGATFQAITVWFFKWYKVQPHFRR